ncbi:hypothetical protein Phi19:3_gp122 [Cellulophaga phage phi19:3]|uniref:Uncharacterized protein n=1 Tax=Cellulophaga phage phi19:3 TaxID=1327971 RepID=R9ZWP3_9CAUD|nr:hypothetical protein Phi19:3_gp122 [Cellulophaga phage phi19:3]AGO47526.1 hypothetical protein Phi19:3_gp122 [Cellulophaga phage phi19:3]
MINDWHKFWRFQMPERSIYPDDVENGIMVEFNNIPICSGFIYATSSSSLFWLEWIVSNPKVKDSKIRKKAINTLLIALTEKIKNSGGRIVFSSATNHNLIDSYLKTGFIKGSINATELIKIIK